jgi:hypothetical protein
MERNRFDYPAGRNRFSNDDEFFDPMSNYPPPPPPPPGRRDYYNDAPSGWGKRPFGVDRRDVDYRSMNGPYDSKENYGYNMQNRDGYNMQSRDSRVVGDFGGPPAQSKWGHVGQSLIDYQVKPPRRGRQPDRIIDVTPSAGDYGPDFDPRFGDQQPYFEPY